jgi:8-oxo-dGTP diphosphatase
MANDQLMFVVQKGFIRKGESVLVLNDPVEGLDFPGGKIQEGETDMVEALKREIREETGLEVQVGAPFVVWTEKFPEGHRHAGKPVYLVAFDCEHVGGEVILSEEHNKFTWVTRNSMKEVDDGTSYYRILEAYFQYKK